MSQKKTGHSIPCLLYQKFLNRPDYKSLKASRKSITALLLTKESLRRSNPLRRSVRILLSGPRYNPFFCRRSIPERVPQLS